MLFNPLRKPNLSKFRLWTDTVPLTDSNCYLQGPFHFESRHDVLTPCNYIARDQWLLLLSSCSVSGIVPLSLSATQSGDSAVSSISGLKHKPAPVSVVPIGNN